MEAAKLSRELQREICDQIIKDMAAEMAKELPDLAVMETEARGLNDVMSKLEGLDNQIVAAMIKAKCSKEEMRQEFPDQREFNKKAELIKVRWEMRMNELKPETEASVNGAKVNKNHSTYRLPKVEIKKFNGEVKNWLSFWAQFQRIHNDPRLHTTDKFQYLAQAMVRGSPAQETLDRFPQSEENYQKVIEVLQEKFGNQKKLMQVYVRELLSLVVMNCTAQEKIKVSQLFDKLDSHLRTLESLKVNKDQMVIFLYPLVESSLPEDVLIAWQRSPMYGCDGSTCVPPKSELDFLMDFLKKEVENEDQRQLVKTGFAVSKAKDQQTVQKNEPQVHNKHKKDMNRCRVKEEDIPTAAGLHISPQKSRSCIFCDKSHPSHECFQAVGMSFEDKKSVIKKKNVCFICLRPGHVSQNCRAFVKCTGCEGKHHHLLCPDSPRNKRVQAQAPEKEVETKAVHSNLVQGQLVLLKTLVVKVFNQKLRILFDDGSQKSYIKDSSAVRKCKILGSYLERNMLFGGALTDVEKRTTYSVVVRSLDGKVRKELPLASQPTIAKNIPTVPNGPWIKELREKNIMLNDSERESDEIDILIGSDLLPSLLTGNSVMLECGLIAYETVFGWTLMGPVPSSSEQSVAMTVTSLHVTEFSCSQLWDLETLGIKDPAEKKTKEEKEAEVKKHFTESVEQKEDGRYVVSLPWIGGVQQIPTNKSVAEVRLKSTTSKLKKDGMFQAYNKIFEDWESEGFITEVTSDDVSGCHYIPHRAVYKPSSRTTPVRPVFDASCKVGRNPSLNDCLEKGPNFIELIPSVMMRFREGKIGVLSDIRKAFQMIEVCERDSNYLRFLWWESDECLKLKIYKHNRVVFGVNCSPFLLGAVIEHHLSSVSEGDSAIAHKLLKSFYVDNCVTSVNSMEEYWEFKIQATEFMSKAKMQLREWEFSAEETSGVDPTISGGCGLEFVSPNLTPTVTSVLGMEWDKVQDFIRCDSIPEVPDKLTKRTLLSTVQKIFDPMGFLSPVMVVPKLTLQEAWAQKIGWDDELPDEIQLKFKKWSDGLKHLEEIHIPRSMNDGMTSRDHYELHMFCDASQYAYGAAIFLRVVMGKNISVQLLQAKARVAPLKPTSIPRLELLSCTIGARLTESVKQALNLKAPTYYWSDSTTALAWIKRNDEWGTFVGNRVREICELTNPTDWRHVPGIYNPADLPSRGCTPEELLASRWWEGPSWLKLPQQQWPTEEVILDEETILKERKKSTPVPVLLLSSSEDSWYAKFSSYSKCVRIKAYMNRFVKGVRKQMNPSSGELTTEEIDFSEKSILKSIQGEAFPSSSENVICGLRVVMVDGLICVVTKLTNRQDTSDFKYPVLVPHNHLLVERMIREEHLRHGHRGIQFLMSKLREKVWIVQSRKAIRSVVKGCVRCRRHSTKAPEVPVAPLPENRVKDARVFEVTGVDLAGPLFLKDKSKVWIVLFTCAVYRGIHLELVNSLNTDSFLLALMRFISRRGRPSIIYSDNGTNFVGAVNLFSQMDWKKIKMKTQLQRIRWIFNPPSAAWWGGWWERLIRTVKDLLKKMLGYSKLGYIQLETCLAEVEAVVNARPLTYVTEDQDDLVPLTPAMFMQDLTNTMSPEAQALDATGLNRKYKDLVTLKEELRHRFRAEYLGQLVQKGKKKSSREFVVGEIVLVASDNRKRLQWPMARILELIPGRDGHIRVAKIRTATGEFVRPLQRLIPLEVRDDAEIPSPNPDLSETGERGGEMKTTDGEEKTAPVTLDEPEIVTRAGRQVNKPLRFRP